MISLRQIPPLSLGSDSDQVLFGALTDGPSIVVFPVMRAHAEVVTASALASAKEEPLNKKALPEAAAVVMIDAHALVYALKPVGIIIDLEGGRMRPSIVVGTDASSEFIPISPSLMALLAGVWGIALIADGDEFAEHSVDIPGEDVAVEWSRRQFARVFSEMIATRFQGVSFDTNVPEHLAIRLGLIEGAEA